MIMQKLMIVKTNHGGGDDDNYHGEDGDAADNDENSADMITNYTNTWDGNYSKEDKMMQQQQLFYDDHSNV